MTWIYVMPWIFLAGMLAGALGWRAAERRKWRRGFERIHQPGAVSVLPPTDVRESEHVA